MSEPELQQLLGQASDNPNRIQNTIAALNPRFESWHYSFDW